MLLDTNVGTCYFFLVFEFFNKSHYLQLHKWRVPEGISQMLCFRRERTRTVPMEAAVVVDNDFVEWEVRVDA